MASRENSSFRDFLDWSNRQIIITRVYAPRLWRMGLFAHGLYCSTWLLGIALLILPGASHATKSGIAVTLLAILSLGFSKGRIRTTAARELFPEERETLKRWGARYWQLCPLVPWIMLANFVTAGFKRTIEWRGTIYELRSEDEVRVMRRA